MRKTKKSASTLKKELNKLNSELKETRRLTIDLLNNVLSHMYVTSHKHHKPMHRHIEKIAKNSDDLHKIHKRMK